MSGEKDDEPVRKHHDEPFADLGSSFGFRTTQLSLHNQQRGKILVSDENGDEALHATYLQHTPAGVHIDNEAKVMIVPTYARGYSFKRSRSDSWTATPSRFLESGHGVSATREDEDMRLQGKQEQRDRTVSADNDILCRRLPIENYELTEEHNYSNERFDAVSECDQNVSNIHFTADDMTKSMSHLSQGEELRAFTVRGIGWDRAASDQNIFRRNQSVKSEIQRTRSEASTGMPVKLTDTKETVSGQATSKENPNIIYPARPMTRQHINQPPAHVMRTTKDSFSSGKILPYYQAHLRANLDVPACVPFDASAIEELSVKMGLYAVRDHGCLCIFDEMPKPSAPIAYQGYSEMNFHRNFAFSHPASDVENDLENNYFQMEDGEDNQREESGARATSNPRHSAFVKGQNMLSSVFPTYSSSTTGKTDMHNEGMKNIPYMYNIARAKKKAQFRKRIAKIWLSSQKILARTSVGFHFMTMSRRRWKTIILFLTVPAWVYIWTVIYTLVEGWTPIESLYFIVQAFTTVGFGDFKPITTLGMAVFPVASMTGVTLVAAAVAHIAVYVSSNMNWVKIKNMILLFAAVFAFSSVLFMYLEKWTLGQSLFFLYNCASTTGLSEEVPKTRAGRIAFCVLMLIIFSIFTTLIKLIVDRIRKGSDAEETNRGEMTRSEWRRVLRNAWVDGE